MRHPLRSLVIASLLGTVLAAPALAEHARIELVVVGRDGQATAHVDQTPPEWGKNPRPVLHVKAGESVKVRFMLTNVYPHKTLSNAVVHLFVAAEAKAGQKELPDLDDSVVLESAFDVDLKPGAKVGQRSTFRVDRPGAYLVRVESRNTGSDHEHFAAIDLIVDSDGSR